MKLAASIIIGLAVGALIGFMLGQMSGYEQRSREQTVKSYGELVSELRAKELISIHDMVKISSKVETVDEGGLFSVKHVSYLSGSIENIALATAVRDVKVRVDYLSKTEAIISSEEIILYHIIAPSSSRTFKVKITIPEKTDQVLFSLVDLKAD